MQAAGDERTHNVSLTVVSEALDAKFPAVESGYGAAAWHVESLSVPCRPYEVKLGPYSISENRGRMPYPTVILW